MGAVGGHSPPYGLRAGQTLWQKHQRIMATMGGHKI